MATVGRGRAGGGAEGGPVTRLTGPGAGGTLPAMRRRLNISLLAIAAIIAAAMLLGTPGDDTPVCVSELAVADRCDP